MVGWDAKRDTPRVVALEPATRDIAEALAAEPIHLSWIRPGGGHAPRLTGSEAVVVDATAVDDACDLAARIRSTRPDAVLVAITDDADEAAMARLDAAGVAEHVDRHALGQGQLARVVRWAIERRRTLDGAAAMGLADPASGLRNWRGFVTEGRRQAALASRYGLDATVTVFGLVNRDQLAAREGPRAAEAAIQDFGAALGMAVRSTDLPARIGRDEFVVLLLEAGSRGASIVARRVGRELEAVTERERRSWRVEWAHGSARREPDEGLESVVERARHGMERARAARLD